MLTRKDLNNYMKIFIEAALFRTRTEIPETDMGSEIFFSAYLFAYKFKPFIYIQNKRRNINNCELKRRFNITA